MKKSFLLRFLLLTTFTFLPQMAQAKISILACEPEWQALALEIVKDKIDVFSAVAANQNPKKIDLKTQIKKAAATKMFFCTGLELEKLWLERLINDSNNLKVLTDEDSLFLVGDFLYPNGTNLGPRVHLNPDNLPQIAAEFTRRIQKIDPLHKNFYAENLSNFMQKFDKARIYWQKKKTVLKGRKYVVNDNSWGHMAKWLEIEVIPISENKGDSNFKAVWLQEYLTKIKSEPIEAIIYAGFEDKTNLFWLRDKTKIRMVLVPFTVRGAANSASLLDVYTTTINNLLTDCSGLECKSLAPAEKMIIKYK